MKKEFNAREYAESYYGEKVLGWFEEDYGLNGLDMLWSCKDKKEVDTILEGYCL